MCKSPNIWMFVSYHLHIKEDWPCWSVFQCHLLRSGGNLWSHCGHYPSNKTGVSENGGRQMDTRCLASRLLDLCIWPYRGLCKSGVRVRLLPCSRVLWPWLIVHEQNFSSELTNQRNRQIRSCCSPSLKKIQWALQSYAKDIVDLPLSLATFAECLCTRLLRRVVLQKKQAWFWWWCYETLKKLNTSVELVPGVDACSWGFCWHWLARNLLQAMCWHNWKQLRSFWCSEFYSFC